MMWLRIEWRTDLCHAQSVEALPVKLEIQPWSAWQAHWRGPPAALHSSAVRLSEVACSSPSTYSNKLTMSADQTETLDFSANFFPTSSYRAGKSVEVEKPEVKE